MKIISKGILVNVLSKSNEVLGGNITSIRTRSGFLIDQHFLGFINGRCDAHNFKFRVRLQEFQQPIELVLFILYDSNIVIHEINLQMALL